MKFNKKQVQSDVKLLDKLDGDFNTMLKYKNVEKFTIEHAHNFLVETVYQLYKTDIKHCHLDDILVDIIGSNQYENDEVKPHLLRLFKRFNIKVVKIHGDEFLTLTLYGKIKKHKIQIIDFIFDILLIGSIFNI